MKRNGSNLNEDQKDILIMISYRNCNTYFQNVSQKMIQNTTAQYVIINSILLVTFKEKFYDIFKSFNNLNEVKIIEFNNIHSTF